MEVGLLYFTTPKKKVDCFAQKVDFFTRKRGSQSTFCCNYTKKGPETEAPGQVSVIKTIAIKQCSWSLACSTYH